MKRINLLLLFAGAISLSWILHSLGMILPWLFGSMIATILFYRFVSADFKYPKWMGDIGIFIIGIEIGSTFTLTALSDLADDIFNIILLSVLVVLLSLLLSRFFIKMTGCTVETAVLASIPGALSQMILMAEEEKKADLLLVTLTQMSRIVLVVIFVPFIASLSTEGDAVQAEEAAPLLSSVFQPGMLLILLGSAALIYILSKLRFPVPVMIAPLICVLIWNVTTDFTFSVDAGFMYAAQVLFGIRIGLQISSLMSRLNGRMVAAMIFQNVLLIAGTMLIVIAFLMFTEYNFNDLFLSAAPGGIGQIIIVAVEMGADIAMISSYHIFRIFFILLIVAPIINMILTRNRRRGAREHEET